MHYVNKTDENKIVWFNKESVYIIKVTLKLNQTKSFLHSWRRLVVTEGISELIILVE